MIQNHTPKLAKKNLEKTTSGGICFCLYSLFCLFIGLI